MKKIKILSLKIINWFKEHWKLALVILILVIGAFLWKTNQTKKNQPQLTFERPQIRNLTKVLEVSGVVDAKQKARLRFIAGGKVTYIGAQEGDTVKKWQNIASIDKATLEKQLQQDLNLYMKERWDWENTQDNIEDRWIDDQEKRSVDQSQWDLTNEVIDVEIRTQAIKNSSIYSPFDGVLTASPTTVTGVQLLATDYFEVVNPESLIFKGIVDESDISSVSIGQRAKIDLDAYENKTIDANVNYISFTSSQASSGTVFVVEFPLPNPDLSRYRIGMNGDVSIVLDQKENVLSIPFEATKQRDDKIFVDVKDGQTTREQQIEVGLETDQYLEIISGLSENDEVVIPE